MKYAMYLVGGAVRDYYLYKIFGVKRVIKDLDFAIEANTYELMKEALLDAYDITIVQEDAKFGRFKAAINIDAFPSCSITWNLAKDIANSNNVVYADFVLSRDDGDYSDGRRPNSIEPAPIEIDLSRRDFTINAMAINVEDSLLINGKQGLEDMRNRTIRFCGNVADRIAEDYLRVVRMYRFLAIMSYFYNGPYLWKIHGEDLEFIHENATMIGAGIRASVSKERIYEEMLKIFKISSTIQAIELIQSIPFPIRKAIFDEERKLWLLPTMQSL